MSNPSADNVCPEAVFQRLFFEQAEPLRNFLYYKCGEEALAEDLMQEAFLRLWERCRNVSFEKAKSFLFTVANNLLLDRFKHQKVILKFQADPGNKKPSVHDPHFLLEEEEFKKQLEDLINSMPEKSRTVFLMNRIDKMTYAEIAKSLSISVKAVEKRMNKALIAFRELKKNI